MKWNLCIANRAGKALKRFPAKDRMPMLSALEELSEDNDLLDPEKARIEKHVHLPNTYRRNPKPGFLA